MLVRILRPLSGEPRARVRCQPDYEYGLTRRVLARLEPHRVHGLPVTGPADDQRPAHLRRGPAPVPARGHRHLVLTWGEPLEAGLEETAERFLERTLDYWRRWVKGTRVPRDYQSEVVRSALALKLHQYEDTGALLAATTTSLPEHPGSGRTWDYRFCWLRDAYFTLNALERLGHSEEMERFLEYLRNIAEEREGVLQPAYRINGAAEAHGARARAPLRLQRRRTRAHRQPGVRARAERRLRGDGARGQPPLPRHPFRRRDPAADRGRDRGVARRPDRGTARRA